MSTKIMNGYRLSYKTMEEVISFSQKFRAMADEKTLELLGDYLAREITRLIDSLVFMSDKDYIDKFLGSENEKGEDLTLKDFPYQNPWDLAYQKAKDRYHQSYIKHTYDPVFDYDCYAVFIPSSDKMLAIFYASKKAFHELWKSCEEVSYYGYWSNADPEEGVSKEEWEQREKDWEKAVGADTPMRRGLTADFIKGFPSELLVTDDEVLQRIPSLEERATFIAKRKLEESRYHELVELYKQKGKKRGHGVYGEAQRWLRTEEGQASVQKEMQRIMPLLLPEIQRQHLFKPLHRFQAESNHTN